MAEGAKIARNFREYKVWQDAVDYATDIYKMSDQIPWFEQKGICDQIRRAVVSISSNIAEGSAKPTNADFARFLDQALGSSYEVETQMLIARNLQYIPQEQYDILMEQLISIQKQLTGLISSIRNNN